MNFNPAIGVITVSLRFFEDGAGRKLEMKSKFEVKMYETVVNQIKTHPEMSQRSLALCWIYLQA